QSDECGELGGKQVAHFCVSQPLQGGGSSSGPNVPSAVFAQAVVDGGDLRQRKISELDALVIGRKLNDAHERVANLANNLEQGCVLYVCHVPPHVFLVLYGRKIASLDEPESTCQIV